MPKNDELELVKFGLQEVKDQYKVYLDGFNDIKQKNQVLLLICSLIITLPLSSTMVFNKIISSSNFIIALFISGIILLITAIILLILSMKETQVRIPLFEDFLSSIGKYKPLNIMKSFMKAYSNDLNLNITRREKKRYLLRWAEKFIIAGVILVIGTLIIVIMFVN